MPSVMIDQTPASTRHPTIWLVAGPDGVGKTTYAFRHIRTVSGSVPKPKAVAEGRRGCVDFVGALDGLGALLTNLLRGLPACP